MINNNIKVAVCTQSYYRKDGSTKKCLEDMFRMLECQTYKNFKVFITGDNYNPEDEFIAACKNYKGEIYIANNNHSFRELDLGPIKNYWSCGGLLAAYNSYVKAKEEGYDIALMLDDDDYWYNYYIKNVVDNFIKYPETAFMITKSEYCGGFLPKTVPQVNTIYYNNYIPRQCDSVRSASVHNLNIIYNDVKKLWEETFNIVKLIHLNKKTTYLIKESDALLLDFIGENVKQQKYKTLYIPIVSVKKDKDSNWHNIK